MAEPPPGQPGHVAEFGKGGTPPAEADGRLDAPAFHRNHAAVWSVLSRLLPGHGGDVLEIGSGTGQHVVRFAAQSPLLTWWPSDPLDSHLHSIDAWRRHEGRDNVRAPVRLDAGAADWRLAAHGLPSSFAAMFCANVVHIAPWPVAEGIFAGAGRHLRPEGRLFLYGPFRRDGRHNAPSNEAFDANLRRDNPAWGVRDTADLGTLAQANGLRLAELVEMPSNNALLVFERIGPALRHEVSDLFDAQRHEPLTRTPWNEAAARAAIGRICAAAEHEFDETQGNWPWHPQDDPPRPGARSFNFYWGAAGVVWALRHLSLQGAATLVRDTTRWIERYPARMREESAEELHGSASFLFGESAPLLLAWRVTQRSEYAAALYDIVKANLHNGAHEPLWGNAGTMLAAIHCTEAMHDEHEVQRWKALLQEAAEALLADMVQDPETGHWLWEQDLYGRRSRHLGARHGLAGNAFAVLRAGRWIDPGTLRAIEQRTLQTLGATALHATHGTPQREVDLVNWHVLIDQQRIAAWVAKGGRPLVQDCHGAPGIVCRIAGARGASDELLRAAGELTWFAGPLVKGPSLCHGTAGSAMACLKLWRRFGEPIWLERARSLAMHAAEQVEGARARHGQGRHSLWSGDLGVACTLWNCVRGDDAFPTLDVF